MFLDPMIHSFRVKLAQRVVIGCRAEAGTCQRKEKKSGREELQVCALSMRRPETCACIITCIHTHAQSQRTQEIEEALLVNILVRFVGGFTM